MSGSEPTSVESKIDRPPLKRSDMYRPRLGAQRQPLAIKTMFETRAWRELSAQAEADMRPEQVA